MYTIHAHNTNIVYQINTANDTQDLTIPIELIYLRYTAVFIFNVQS